MSSKWLRQQLFREWFGNCKLSARQQAKQMGWGRNTERGMEGPSCLLSICMASSKEALLQARYEVLCWHNQNRTKQIIRKGESIASVLLKYKIIYKSLRSWSIQITIEKREQTAENYHPYHKGNNPYHKVNAQHFSVKVWRSRGNVIKLVGDI